MGIAGTVVYLELLPHKEVSTHSVSLICTTLKAGPVKIQIQGDWYFKKSMHSLKHSVSASLLPLFSIYRRISIAHPRRAGLLPVPLNKL
jgi:hypothetical protein